MSEDALSGKEILAGWLRAHEGHRVIEEIRGLLGIWTCSDCEKSIDMMLSPRERSPYWCGA